MRLRQKIYIPKLYTILLSKDLKNQKIGHRPPSKQKKSLRTQEWDPDKI